RDIAVGPVTAVDVTAIVRRITVLVRGITGELSCSVVIVQRIARAVPGSPVVPVIVRGRPRLTAEQAGEAVHNLRERVCTCADRVTFGGGDEDILGSDSELLGTVAVQTRGRHGDDLVSFDSVLGGGVPYHGGAVGMAYHRRVSATVGVCSFEPFGEP